MGFASGYLSFEGLFAGNAAIQTLGAQDGEFGVSQVEPASAFGRVVRHEPLGEAASFLGREGYAERGGRVRAQVVLNEDNLRSSSPCVAAES